MGKRQHSSSSSSEERRIKKKLKREKKRRQREEEDEPLKPAVAAVEADEGSWDEKTKEFSWNVRSDLVLRVSKFRGKLAVDVRHLWNDKPTKKGIHIPVEVFREIQKWNGLERAVEKVENS